jgi:uncharacterized metal-binding protein YceD (DUF177 family)
MVSVNVSQLLLSGLGTVRELDFRERLADPYDELHLRAPVRGHVRLIRTPDGVLVHSEHVAFVTLECARCLEEAAAEIEGVLDEEFLPSTDIRTGAPIEVPAFDEQPLIDDHHEIDLDEVLRQNILTNLPLRPLCEAACPGLCSTCGQRLDTLHTAHADENLEEEVPVDASSPFARLATLLNGTPER